MTKFQIALVVIFAMMANSLAVPLSVPIPVNMTQMKTMGTIIVDGVGPISIVSQSPDNVKVNLNCLFK